jgi:hypothetical protein
MEIASHILWTFPSSRFDKKSCDAIISREKRKSSIDRGQEVHFDNFLFFILIFGTDLFT